MKDRTAIRKKFLGRLFTKSRDALLIRTRKKIQKIEPVLSFGFFLFWRLRASALVVPF